MKASFQLVLALAACVAMASAAPIQLDRRSPATTTSNPEEQDLHPKLPDHKLPEHKLPDGKVPAKEIPHEGHKYTYEELQQMWRAEGHSLYATSKESVTDTANPLLSKNLHTGSTNTGSGAGATKPDDQPAFLPLQRFMQTGYPKLSLDQRKYFDSLSPEGKVHFIETHHTTVSGGGNGGMPIVDGKHPTKPNSKTPGFDASADSLPPLTHAEHQSLLNRYSSRMSPDTLKKFEQLSPQHQGQYLRLLQQNGGNTDDPLAHKKLDPVSTIKGSTTDTTNSKAQAAALERFMQEQYPKLTKEAQQNFDRKTPEQKERYIASLQKDGELPVGGVKQNPNPNSNDKGLPVEAQLTEQQILAKMTTAEKQNYLKMSATDQAAYIQAHQPNDGSRGANGDADNGGGKHPLNPNGKVSSSETKPTKAEVIAKMSEGQKQLYEKLSPADQTAFVQWLMQTDGSGDSHTTSLPGSNGGGSRANDVTP